MPSKFFQFKKNLFLAILLLVIFVLPSKALAENLLTVGSASSSLSGTDSAIFANVDSASPTSTFLLMLRSGSIPKFSVDQSGNVSTPGTIAAGSFTGPLTGTISAGDVTPGAFNSILGTGGNYSFPANVGIGVAVPVYPLHISSSGADTGLLLQNNTTTLNNSASLRFLVSTSALPSNEGARLIFTRTDSPAAADGDLSFWTRGNSVPAERMRITSNGNVGIGITNPQHKLDIYSSDTIPFLRIRHTTSAGYAPASILLEENQANNRGQGIYSFNSLSDTNWYSGVSYGSNNTSWTVSYKNGATFDVSVADVGSALFAIKNSGNVGIGTTTPSAKLTVAGGNIFITDAVITSSTPHAAITKTYLDSALETLSSDLSASTTASNYWLANGTNIYNKNTGNVGIGTTNPGALLHINATDAVTGSLIIGGGKNIVTAIGEINSQIDFRSNDASVMSTNQIGGRITSVTEFNNGANVGMGFYTYTQAGNLLTEKVRITNQGNVGIGTTTPGSLLTVGNNLGLTAGGTIYGALASRYLDLSGVLPLSLNLSGPIKFGNTANACDSTNTGALRYDAVSGQSYLCDGSRWLNQKNCGLMTDDEGNSYNTVQIGGQCWMAENINIGTMAPSGTISFSTTDNIIDKWCYNSDPANCAAYGGLYHFDEAVRGSKVSGARGICPAGWHVPTDAEFNILEKTVSGIIGSTAAQYPCNLSVTGWRRCADDSATDAGGTNGVGKSLKAVGVGNGNNLVGFEGKLSGYRNTDSSFDNLGSYLYLWSSSPSGSSNAWYRYLVSSYSTVRRIAYSRAYGFSVRCVRD